MPSSLSQTEFKIESTKQANTQGTQKAHSRVLCWQADDRLGRLLTDPLPRTQLWLSNSLLLLYITLLLILFCFCTWHICFCALWELFDPLLFLSHTQSNFVSAIHSLSTKVNLAFKPLWFFHSFIFTIAFHNINFSLCTRLTGICSGRFNQGRI